MSQLESDRAAGRRRPAELREADFREPQRRRKLLLGAGGAVLVVVVGLVVLMARGPDPAGLAQQGVESMLRELPVGVLAESDIQAVADAVEAALELDVGNAAAVEAWEQVRVRVEAQVANQIEAGALDAAQAVFAAASAAWADAFDRDGFLAGRLASAEEERELRAEVARLVAAAEERLRNGGTRERDGAGLRDALAQLEEALALDPDNAQAQSARAGIATKAKAATREALAAGEPQRARQVLDAVDGDWPEDSELGGLRREVEDKLEALGRQAEVERLLGLAADRLAQDRLGQPAGDNAVEYYRRVLTLSPGNAAAEDGLARAGARYAVLTRAALAEGALDRARRLRGSFERAIPGHPELAALVVEIEAAESAVAEAERLADAEARSGSQGTSAPAARNGPIMAEEPVPVDDEGRLWQAVKDSCAPDDLRRYTVAYPAGRYVDEAWQRMSACLEAR